MVSKAYLSVSLILQTLQQLRDVYGDSVDKIVQGNTSNIIFLKSTDDSMIDTLQKMSGTTHRSYVDSKTVTRDNERLMFKNEGKTSYTMTTREEPVIKYNDMAFIGERNSIVFRAGDNPIWNRNETILPMAWRLFSNPIRHPGHSYSFQTLPSLSTVKEFDIRKNQPDFSKMLDKRMRQALKAKQAQKKYQEIYGYSDYEIEQLDPDDYADEIMEVINIALREGLDYSVRADEDPLGISDYEESMIAGAEENVEQKKATAEAMEKYDVKGREEKRFVNHTISPLDLVNPAGQVNRGYNQEILRAYTEIRSAMENDSMYFHVINGNLCDAHTNEVYIRRTSESETLQYLEQESKNEESRVFSEGGIENAETLKKLGSYEVTDAFIRFLARQDSWDFADGKFEETMARFLQE